MSTIVTRAAKGSALTHNEVDANFVNLNTDKVEKAGTDPVSISVNSTSDALRITQTGTGNAFVVEDSGSPDATPFIVDFAGGVIQGYGTFLPTDNYAGNSMVPNFQKHGGAISSASIASTLWNSGSGSNAGGLVLSRSKSATIGTNASVVANDTLGTVSFNGDDGTAFIPSAYISGAVDGTPGTNNMPGRLVFATTPSGGSAPTERMRIGSDGSVGIGVANAPNYTVRSGRDITGSTSGGNFYASGTAQSDVTGNNYGYLAENKTAAAAFTLNAMFGYRAIQGTFGAGSTVNSQYGFSADSTLTGATNNYGFYGNIAAGTGRYNFYANGTADNYFAGNVQFATGSAASPALTNISDTNTGIFFPAADTIAFAEGGVETMRIDSSGNLKFNSGYGSVATAYGCRAWVNFNGTGTVAIRASGNVSSITDNSTGDYTVNFATAMVDANYSVVGSTGQGDVTFQGNSVSQAGFPAWTVSSARILTRAGANYDTTTICVAIFR